MLKSQTEIEEDIFEDSKQRLLSDDRKTRRREAWSESKVGVIYTRKAVTPFAEALRYRFSKFDNNTRIRTRAENLLVNSGLEADTVAYLFTKALFNSMFTLSNKRVKRVTLCIRCADVIHDEMRIRFFAKSKNRKNLLKKLFKQFDKRSYPRAWRKRTILNYFHEEQISWTAWSNKQKLEVGYALLVWFRDCTHLVIAPKSSVWVDPSEGLRSHVESTLKERVIDFTFYRPMVTTPRPWSMENLFRGGYLSPKVKSYPLIKRTHKRDVKRLLDMDLSRIIPAVNSLQETPWRVNTKILSILEWCMYERDGNIAGLPKASTQELPPLPYNYLEDESVKKEHNRRCFLIHSSNRTTISKRLGVLSVLSLAAEFKDYPQIYFPHNLDSRGRAYPLPSFLNPQGPDYVKALLEFAEGKPILNDKQACWLAIAGANAYGQDKMPLQNRVDWVQENQDELIFSIAEDPMSDLRWTQASDPFQFLRFCLEWCDFWHTGYGFVSHMVVPVDATCSGIQHYSAMFKDEVGGRSVNLIPLSVRQDIYQDVADKVNEKLMLDGSDTARSWLKFGIDRAITKRQVMVVPYAGTMHSCMEYTREAVEEKVNKGFPIDFNLESDKEFNAKIGFLSKFIWESISETVIKGKEAMQWFSKITDIYCKWANENIEGDAYDKSLAWVTPDGFPVRYYAPEEKKTRVVTFLDGRTDLVLFKDLPCLSPQNMRTAIAPNFIHSMDATLMRMAMMIGLTKGIISYAMVHDSFGVHAACMQEFLDECIKPAFVQMYANNPIESLLANIPFGIGLPEAPKPGNLEVNDVLHSEFFFS